MSSEDHERIPPPNIHRGPGDEGFPIEEDEARLEEIWDTFEHLERGGVSVDRDDPKEIFAMLEWLAHRTLEEVRHLRNIHAEGNDGIEL